MSKLKVNALDTESGTTITVAAGTDAPVLATDSAVSIAEDASGATSLSASDVDGDDLFFNILGGNLSLIHI